VILAPSILAADFSRLADEVARAEAGGAGLVHADVMDGHFVPNLTMGPALVKSVRGATRLPIDVHLMIERPDDFIDAFADAGADWMSVHVETVPHLHRTLDKIRSRGVRAGVVLNPATPLGALEEALPYVDYVLVMSVNPGFGGQKFIDSALHKVERLRRVLVERSLAVQVEIDGGVDLSNIRRVVESGVDIAVAGAAVFGGGDPEGASRALIAACR
jgi:ribulose-phosphate 3-epimerase